ncbi:MAG: alpha/beta fold hydrolase [Alcanivorax sp.]|nr:alpha/beta fold hydrolase [Alcanivorax sp.]
MDNNKHALIGKIYETALSPGGWVDLLDTIAGWTEASMPDVEPEEHSHGLARPVATVSRGEEIEALVSHLERAVRSSSYMHGLEDRISVLNAMYNQMPWPMLILGENLTVLESNPVTQQVLATGPVKFTADRQLVFKNRELKRSLERVNRMAQGRGPQLLSSPQDGISLLCLPVQKSDAPGPINLVRTIVWVLDGHSVVTPSPELLRSLFNITSAESRLLHLLCKIGNLQQCSQLLDIKISTARSHLKSVMGKLNVTSQVQLVSHAMGHALAQVARLPRNPDNDEEFTVTLPDGRVLSWYEYGDPTGRPVLNLENQGASMPDHALFDDWYREQGLRMIMIVRPGYGISTYKADFQFRDLGKDILFLCEHLKICKPALTAYCGGGPYALCAAARYPDSFECLGLLGTTLAIEHFEVDKLDPLHRMCVQISRRDPRLFMLVGRLGVRGVQKAPEKFYKMLAKGLSKADRAFFENPDFLARTIRRTRRSHFQGARVMMEEYLNHLRPLGEDPGKIRIPVLQWHGETDGIVSIDGARALAADIPNVRFRSFPELGHFMIYDLWKDFLTELLDL